LAIASSFTPIGGDIDAANKTDSELPHTVMQGW